MTKRTLATALALLGLLAGTGLALAKGPPAKVLIEGPGLAVPVEITDPEALLAFSFFLFEDLDHKIDAPAGPGQGYVITRYIEDQYQRVKPWDRVIYYPGAGNALGVVYLEGLIGDSATEFDGYWYRASAQGDAAMRALLVGNSRQANPARPNAAPSSLPFVVLIGLAGLCGAVWLAAGRDKARTGAHGA